MTKFNKGDKVKVEYEAEVTCPNWSSPITYELQTSDGMFRVVHENYMTLLHPAMPPIGSIIELSSLALSEADPALLRISKHTTQKDWDFYNKQYRCAVVRYGPSKEV
jgi:hypothetical protein